MLRGGLQTTPGRCQTSMISQARLSGIQFTYNTRRFRPMSPPEGLTCGTSSHTSRVRLTHCVARASTGAASAAWSDDLKVDSSPQQRPSDAGVLTAFTNCRAVLMPIFCFAAWAYLCSGSSSLSPFASMSAAADVATSGHELAAKSAWTGMATGVFHTLCGPDHLAGLAPLSLGRSRMAAAALGALWGFGHSTGQFILGLIFALLKDKFHDLMPALDKWSAYIVPLTLITIGLVGIYENFSRKDEDDDHDHAIPANGQRFGFMTYFTGIVHGLQPDALYVVIPALALPTKMAAVAFITMFVVGTCLSMGLYTLIIGTTSKALIKEQPWLQSHLSTIACGIAILCGVLMLLAGQGVSVPFFG